MTATSSVADASTAIFSVGRTCRGLSPRPVTRGSRGASSMRTSSGWVGNSLRTLRSPSADRANVPLTLAGTVTFADPSAATASGNDSLTGLASALPCRVNSRTAARRPRGTNRRSNVIVPCSRAVSSPSPSIGGSGSRPAAA